MSEYIEATRRANEQHRKRIEDDYYKIEDILTKDEFKDEVWDNHYHNQYCSSVVEDYGNGKQLLQLSNDDDCHEDCLEESYRSYVDETTKRNAWLEGLTEEDIRINRNVRRMHMDIHHQMMDKIIFG